MDNLARYAGNSKNQKIGLATSIIAHGIVLTLCYFFLKWTPPDPPLPDYGVELNFGLDDEGFGTLQTLAPPSDQENMEDAAPNDVVKEELLEPQPVAPILQEPKAEPQQEITPSLTQDVEDSPVEVAPKPKPAEPIKKVEKPIDKPVDTKPVQAKDPYKPEKSEEGGRGVKGTSTNMAGNNNGDRPGKVGDQGNPQGSLDAKALYGTPGSGKGGSSLDMAGWTWDSRPDDTDKSNETGRIVFKIKVDQDGQIVSVFPTEKTVSPATVKFYQKQIEAITFSKTSDNVSAAPISEGKITIIIKGN